MCCVCLCVLTAVSGSKAKPQSANSSGNKERGQKEGGKQGAGGREERWKGGSSGKEFSLSPEREKAEDGVMLANKPGLTVQVCLHPSLSLPRGSEI